MADPVATRRTRKPSKPARPAGRTVDGRTLKEASLRGPDIGNRARPSVTRPQVPALRPQAGSGGGVVPPGGRGVMAPSAPRPPVPSGSASRAVAERAIPLGRVPSLAGTAAREALPRVLGPAAIVGEVLRPTPANQSEDAAIAARGNGPIVYPEGTPGVEYPAADVPGPTVTARRPTRPSGRPAPRRSNADNSADDLNARELASIRNDLNRVGNLSFAKGGMAKPKAPTPVRIPKPPMPAKSPKLPATGKPKLPSVKPKMPSLPFSKGGMTKKGC